MTAALVTLGEEGGAAIGAEAGAEEGSAELPTGRINLGNGNSMEFSTEQFREILHSDGVVEALRERAQGVANECNATKKKKRARYSVLVQNDEWTTRARAFVKPDNEDARYDDAMHSTMLKAAANAPNDPRMGSGEVESEGDSGADEGIGMGEAAEAEEFADVAIVAL